LSGGERLEALELERVRVSRFQVEVARMFVRSPSTTRVARRTCMLGVCVHVCTPAAPRVRLNGSSASAAAGQEAPLAGRARANKDMDML